MNKFKDLLGNEGMDQDCLVTCMMKDLCLLEGCRVVHAARNVKDTATNQSVHGASTLINRALKSLGPAAVMRVIPSRRRQRRAAIAKARKENKE